MPNSNFAWMMPKSFEGEMHRPFPLGRSLAGINSKYQEFNDTLCKTYFVVFASYTVGKKKEP